MAVQGGTSGMGMRKIGRGGFSPPSSRTKQSTARDMNRDADDQKKRRPKNPMFGSVREALERTRPR